MTLQNGLVFGRKAYLWCDTGFFDTATGKLVAVDSKAFQGTDWPWAGATSSNGGNPHEITAAIGRAFPSDVPSLLIAASEALRAYAAEGYLARLLLATWQDRPQLWLGGTDDCHGGGAFTFVEGDHYVNSGANLPELARAQRRGFTPKRMARLIDAQLAAPAVLLAGAFGAAGCSVQYGGEVVQVEVSRPGVKIAQLRWVDGPMGIGANVSARDAA